MRTSLTLLLSLLLLSLASSACRSQPRPGGKGKARPAAKAPEPSPSWEVKGLGEDREAAEKDALEKARTVVTAYLRTRKPPVSWSPPPEYIRERLVVGEPSQGKDEEIRTEKRVYTLQSWTWTVTVAPEEYRLLEKEDRQAKSEERLLLAGKVTGGLVLLLAVLAGYLHLDEWTRGAYTRWLRLALVSAAVGVGAGLVLLA
jgi:hypothetical protein